MSSTDKEKEAIRNGFSNAAVIDASSQDTLAKDYGSSGSEFTISSGDENPERGNWQGKLDFLLSCIGFAVGLGNVWRFPYLCYRNGGGAFLIPYTLMLALAGLPLFFMELSFGQFAGLGPITIWKISPIFKGLGYAMVVISGMVCIYYNIIIAWTLFYMFASFTSELPWSSCAALGEWTTPNCTDGNLISNATGNHSSGLEYCNETLGIIGGQGDDCIVPKTPSQVYWENRVLQMSDGIEIAGNVRWELALCLLLAWGIVFLCLIKGVKSSGKVVYFTATFPYIVLVILLVRGATLPGAIKGVEFYVTPKWEKLLDAKVWGDAAVQIFYSLGPAWGGLITMASYNKFNNNCYRDAVIVAITNCGTSVFAGFVIFSVIGFMSDYTGLPVDKVAASGPGLAFVAYPEGIAKMPVSPLWSILFFFMLLTLGLDSQFVMLETVISAFVDEFPDFLRPRKTWFSLGLVIVMYLLGLPCITNGGIYMFQLIDWYSAGQSLMLVALFECICINWIYGYSRFAKDIEMMLGFRPNYYWTACWIVLTPAVIVFIIVFTSVQYTPVTYNGYVYPQWAEVIGWLMTAVSLVMIPIWAIIQLVKFSRKHKTESFLELLKLTASPTPEWGPVIERFKSNTQPIGQDGYMVHDDKSVGSTITNYETGM